MDFPDIMADQSASTSTVEVVVFVRGFCSAFLRSRHISQMSTSKTKQYRTEI